VDVGDNPLYHSGFELMPVSMAHSTALRHSSDTGSQLLVVLVVVVVVVVGAVFTVVAHGKVHPA